LLTAGHDRELIYLHHWGKNFLKENGIDDYAISAEILLCHVLNLSRSDMLLNPRQNVDQIQIEQYKEVIFKRAKREPLQYLLGYVDFFNVRIKCDPRALIPRPETEILVETVLERLKGMRSPRILDLGTGSGNIAVALAKNISDAAVMGVDISEKALELAGENALANEVGDNVNKGFVENLGLFDCVVSNPPYVAEHEKDKLQPEVIEFEPAEALFSSGDPLRFFRAIIESAPRILNQDGLLAFEVGLGQSDLVKELMSTGFADIKSLNDLAGIERVVTGIIKNV
jgi:release factor glutamine methyltransferase